MDLYKAIQQLYAERERLDRVITSLERLQKESGPTPSEPAPRRRGRKNMSAEERRQVSERMKQYWATRRREPSGGSL